MTHCVGPGGYTRDGRMDDDVVAARRSNSLGGGRRLAMLGAALAPLAAEEGPAHAAETTGGEAAERSAPPMLSSFGSKETDADRTASLVSTAVAVALFAALGAPRGGDRE